MGKRYPEEEDVRQAAEVLVRMQYVWRDVKVAIASAYASVTRRLRAALAWTTRGPWLALSAATAPIIAGLCASAHPTDIENSLKVLSSGTWTPWATAFWVAVLLTGLSFGLVQWQQSLTTDDLLEVTKRLQTLPPKGFVTTYQEQFRVALTPALAVLAAEEELSAKEIEEEIRTAMASLLKVVANIDPVQGATYGANIMLWVPAGRAFEQKDAQPIIEYSDDVRGHLELVKALSTTSGSQNFDADEKVRPVVVPVPNRVATVRDRDGHPRSPVLPGAPRAFVNGSLLSYETMDTFFDWVDNNLAAHPAVARDLKRYFDVEAVDIQSFASLAIVPPSPDMGVEPLGVLNIHSTREGLLRDNGQNIFGPLLDPFLALLAILIVNRSNALVAPSHEDTGGSESRSSE